MLLVGLDIGTTAVKAVVFDEDGTALAEGRSATPWSFSNEGTQLEASELLTAASAALTKALSASPSGAVASIGITSMGESGVLIGRDGQALGPVIAWHDRRDLAELENLRSAIAEDLFASRTGLPLREQWSLTKHRWLLTHVPETRRAMLRLNIAEWMAFALGGAPVSELSLASRTGWMDLTSRNWWSETLEWAGVAQALMPEHAVAGTNIGTVSAGAGISRLAGAAITVAGHDHQAAVVGAGAYLPGDVLDSCGTAEALVRIIDPAVSESAMLELTSAGITAGWSVIDQKWTLLGGTQAGLVLRNALNMLGLDTADIARLDAEASHSASPLYATIHAGQELLLHGSTNSNNQADIWRAALGAVTQQALDVHSRMTRAAGTPSRMVVTGGWSLSRGLLENKEKVFGPLTVSPAKEAGARGAALFGGLAAGIYRSVEEFPSGTSQHAPSHTAHQKEGAVQ
ncbi:FGGY-family carbohydrate kinase [Paenarthrobacter nitroguajacolicus]|uniref:FGGY-family carbohydrate kinase n=1 Tax=Paenarthrobacter nitroguajacolicus TaxID=211146 RepID=UPI00248CC57C|nr:FGGY family carbohydrate kinase [Paenarthrobacter nitroguajacolicus]MDI2035142.1 Glycerol kinase [Paenarthrobacter nitroguajacolicus]